MLLNEKTIEIAIGYSWVREVGGNNRGPEVERFLRTVHCNPGDPWCAAFVCTCIEEAYKLVGLGDGLVGPMLFQKSASALGIARVNPNLVIKAPVPGCIGIIDHGKGKGHVFFIVDSSPNGHLYTMEGNTNADPSSPTHDRDGGGCYPRKDRKLSDCCALVRIG